MRIVGGNNGFHTVGPDQNSRIMVEFSEAYANPR